MTKPMKVIIMAILVNDALDLIGFKREVVKLAHAHNINTPNTRHQRKRFRASDKVMIYGAQGILLPN